MTSNAASPDSLPSLSALSRASSEVYDSFSVFVESPDSYRGALDARKLFDIDTACTYDSDRADGCQSVSPVINQRVENIQATGMLESVSKFSDGLDKLTPIAVSTCDSKSVAASPRKLADIFTMFSRCERNSPMPNSKYQWTITEPSHATLPDTTTEVPIDDGNDAVTEVTNNFCHHPKIDSRMRVESLEREIATLKEILQSDSTNILKLKTNLENIRINASKHLVEAQRLRIELHAVTKERDELNERELEHLETIRVLKLEIDKVTQKVQDLFLTSEELDRIRLENELFASQIIENEIEMRQIQSILQLIQGENETMQLELQQLRSRYEGENIPASVSGGHGDFFKFPQDFADKLLSLETRLSIVEQDRITTKTLHRESQKNIPRDSSMTMTCHSTISSTQPSIDISPGEFLCDNDETNYGVEVTLDGPVEPDSKREMPYGDIPAKDEDFSNLCDCFPSLRVQSKK